MTRPAYMTALAYVQAESESVGGFAKRWPGLILDDFEHNTLHDYGVFRNIFTIGRDRPVELVFENRKVAFHGTGVNAGNGAGAFLYHHWIAIERMLPEMQEMPFWRFQYKDWGFRFGYGTSPRFRSFEHDPKAFGLYRAMTVLLQAANEHCLFIRKMDFGNSQLHYRPEVEGRLGLAAEPQSKSAPDVAIVTDSAMGRHVWKRGDDVVAVYLAKFGEAQLGLSIERIAAKLGMPAGSMKMRVANVRSIAQGGKLDHAAKQTREVYGALKNDDEASVRAQALAHLNGV